MSILYLLTSPEPVIEGTDAVWQEVEALQAAFPGKRINLFPLKKPSSLFPKTLYGLHLIQRLRSLESKSKINHIFVATVHYLPLFYWLRNPIIYTVVASLQQQRKPLYINKLKRLHQIVVSNKRDQGVLESWGLNNYSIIRPGIEASCFSPHRFPLKGELTLLMASAPWENAQFDSKGIDLLLETARRLPFLKLIFLWRGLLVEELHKKIEQHGVRQKVEVIDRKVNVNNFLEKAHATISLAKYPYLVKAFPHSLIESLAAGKPVVISNTIPMADYVKKQRCGVVVEDLRLDSLIESIKILMSQYQSLARNANHNGARDFSLENMINQYRGLYQ